MNQAKSDASEFEKYSAVVKLLNDGTHYLLSKPDKIFEPTKTSEWPELELIIKALDCSDEPANPCYDVSSDEKATVINKRGGYMKFEVWESLKIENIVIDSLDSVAKSKFYK